MGPTIHANPSDFEVKSHVARLQKYRAVRKFEGALPLQLALWLNSAQDYVTLAPPQLLSPPRVWVRDQKTEFDNEQLCTNTQTRTNTEIGLNPAPHEEWALYNAKLLMVPKAYADGK